MKILVSCIPYDRGKSGISVYTHNLITRLAEQGHDLTLLTEPGTEEFFKGFRTIPQPAFTRKAIVSMLWHLFVLPFRIKARDYDFCIIAAGNRRMFAFCPLYTIAVVHDLAQYHVKQKYDRLRMVYLKTVLPFFVRRASKVCAISESTKTDMIRFWHVPEHKIFVNYNGLTIYPECESHFREKHSLVNVPYLLYVSRIQHPGKNHINLIHAYEKLPRELTEKHPLVLAGSDWDGAETVHEAAEASPLRARILFTGFLEKNEMREAYEHCACYVFPSFFEGFGLSLIEAMHFGVPCCASDNSSLGEIGHGAALLFPPDDVDAMSNALRRVLTDGAERERLIAAGHTRSAEFDWNKHAKKMIEEYEQKN